MSMNPYLAELYNTNGYQEKIAQIEANVDAFIKAANAEGLDLSGLSDDEIINHAQEWASNQEPESDGTDKLAEADFMGRAMAHAYVDELEKISETKLLGDGGRGAGKAKAVAEEVRQNVARSGSSPQKLLGDGGLRGSENAQKLRALKATVGEHLGKHRNKYLAAAGLAAGAGIGAYASRKKESAVSSDAVATGRNATNWLRSLSRKAADEAAKKDKIRAAVKGVSAAGLGLGAGYGAHAAVSKATEKKSHMELLEEAAVGRANEMLEAAEQGVEITFQKAASLDEDNMDRLITERAWQMLAEEGYL